MDGATLKGVSSVLWPLVVAGALWGFRNEVRALITRLRRVGTQGAEFNDNAVLVQSASVPEVQALKDATPIETHPHFIIERVDRLRKELDTLHQNSDANRITLLLLRLAEAQQGLDFQFIWFTIFTSQLEALEGMLASGSTLDLAPYFEAHLARYTAFVAARDGAVPPGTFDAWVGYLTRNGVIELTGRMGRITEKGRMFLTFAKRWNLPKNQSF